jgi:hypothetical protein
MNRNRLYLIIGALAVAIVVLGYLSYRSGRKLLASRSTSTRAAFSIEEK